MKPKDTKQMFEALADVVDKASRGAISRDNGTMIIESSKVMASILNYELKEAKLRYELGEKDVKINKVTE